MPPRMRGPARVARFAFAAVLAWTAGTAAAQIRVAGLQSGGPQPATAPLLESPSSGLEDFGTMWGFQGGRAGGSVDPLTGLKPLAPVPSGAMRDAPSAAPAAPRLVRLPDGRVLPWAADRGPAVPLPRPRPERDRAAQAAPPGPPIGGPLPALSAGGAARGMTGLVWGRYDEQARPPSGPPRTLLDHLRLPSALPGSLDGADAESLSRLAREDYGRRSGLLSDGGAAGTAAGRATVLGAEGGARKPVPTFVVAELRLPPGLDAAEALPALARETGFRPSDSLPVLAAALSKGRVAVRGWIDEGSLPALLRHRWVAEASLEYPVGFEPLPSSSGREAVYATLRLDGRLSPEDGLRAALGELAGRGFEWRRTVGFQDAGEISAPDRIIEGLRSSGQADLDFGPLVVVYGEAPAGRLGEILKDPVVMRLDPSERLRPSAAPPAPSLRSVLERPLWLFLAASLLLGFSWASSLLRFLLSLL